MCGIVGSFPAIDQQILKNSLDCIRHRGPDEQQQVNTLGGSLGHARLAILDVADGHQPMQDGHCWIAFNGEIYNYQALRQQLPGPFYTNSDTEVVLRCYQEKGQDCPSFLDGMFAFAILDGGDLFLARDPIGIKPLYFARQAEHIYFASEIKALLPFTSDVQEFPPGFSWHSRDGFRQFYRLDPLRQTTLTNVPSADSQVLTQIKSVLLNAVTKRLIADDGVTIGISLSGGLDSSIIAALARFAKERIDTFAVSMPEGEDLPASQQMAKFLGTRHHPYVYTFDEMLKALPEIIYYLESYDAALVRSAIPNYFLARLASDHVKVILTGEGADELFAGYEYLKPVVDAQALQDELWTILSNLHNTNLQRTDRMTMAHGIEGRVPFLDQQVIETAFQLPAAWKAQATGRPEKELLRRSFQDLLPESIAWRPKQKFSKGTGSANLIAEYARETISDEGFDREQKATPVIGLRSKEELLYYRIFREQYGDRIPQEVIGRTRSVTRDELI
jgi:asparagine synthase (glutamine-hydrolysing)